MTGGDRQTGAGQADNFFVVDLSSVFRRSTNLSSVFRRSTTTLSSLLLRGSCVASRLQSENNVFSHKKFCEISNIENKYEFVLAFIVEF